MVLDHDPEDYVRIVANPFLGFTVASWSAALLFMGAIMTPQEFTLPSLCGLAIAGGIAFFVAGRLVVFHCRDCGESGRLLRWRVHNCVWANERRRLGRPRRFRGPTPVLQVVIWFWILLFLLLNLPPIYEARE